MIRILFLGDIVGSSGRRIIKNELTALKEKEQIDLVIANAENAAHGKGLTYKIYNQLCQSGIDYFTMGNHAYAKPDIFRFLDEVDNLVIPYNLDPNDQGKTVVYAEVKGKKIGIANLMGEVFMHQVIESPFSSMDYILRKMEDCDLKIVDVHAEATSEKIAFAYAFKDQLSLIVGTHTHVQTADERILDGCGCITDLGMCGTYHSILGRDVDEILARFQNNEKQPYKIAEGFAMMNGIIAEFDEDSDRCVNIKRIQIIEKES